MSKPRFTIYPPGRFGTASKARFTAALNKAARLRELSWDSSDSRWFTSDESAATIMESAGCDVFDRALPGYQRSIWKVTGCELEDASVINELMWVERSTLDSLDKRQFNALARKCQKQLAWLRQNDPECAAWYEDMGRGEWHGQPLPTIEEEVSQ